MWTKHNTIVMVWKKRPPKRVSATIGAEDSLLPTEAALSAPACCHMLPFMVMDQTFESVSKLPTSKCFLSKNCHGHDVSLQ